MIYPEWNIKYISKKHNENKAKIINDFIADKNDFDAVVDEFFSKDVEIDINFFIDTIKYKVNGKEENLSAEDYALFSKLCSILNCERIRIYKNSSENKVIEILIPYNESCDDIILYCPDNTDQLTDEFSPGWYFDSYWYT